MKITVSTVFHVLNTKYNLYASEVIVTVKTDNNSVNVTYSNRLAVWKIIRLI